MGSSPFAAGGRVAEIKGNLAYYPRIENANAAEEFAKKHRGRYILFGEYGLSPFLLKIEERISPRPLVEVLLSNKNRQLFADFLRSAHAAGFSGAVIASGPFEKNADMPMPVFDLDAAQALHIAIEMKKAGVFSNDFLVGVRAAAGSEPATLRARNFLDSGADFIVLSNAKHIEGIEPSIMFCGEATQ